MIRSLFLVSASVLLANAASAASFDCDKAAKPDEKAICANRALNDADVRMATMFELGTNISAMGERDALRAAQSKWLDGRAGCKDDVACLTAAYDKRLADLKKLFTSFEERAAP